MPSRIWKILRDLLVDGYSVVGAAALLLAIVFIAAKAFDTIPNLSNISYAWGLLPILVWVAVAYVRRCRRYNDLEQQTIGFRNRAEGLARLAALRERGVALRNKAVNKQPEMEQWLKANAQWLNEVYGVVGAVSVSLAARIRTLGTVGPNVTEVSQPPSATTRTPDPVGPSLNEVSQPRSATIRTLDGPGAEPDAPDLTRQRTGFRRHISEVMRQIELFLEKNQ